MLWPYYYASGASLFRSAKKQRGGPRVLSSAPRHDCPCQEDLETKGSKAQGFEEAVDPDQQEVERQKARAS